jgi:N-acetylglucosamine kinase-like BadF-type ATPase
MRYLMGIDSGGSKTLGLLEAAGEGGPPRRWQAQVGNTNHHTCGPETAVQRVAELIEALCGQAALAPAALDGVCFAGAGIDSVADEGWMADALASLGCGGRLLVCSDALAALAGANGALTGGMLLSGTGSIALGIDRRGARVRVGGWGYKLDDAGSGYGIAILGLRAAYEALDGRGPATAIGAALLEHTGHADLHALLDALYAPDCTPDAIARLAPHICALDGRDEVAGALLDAAAQALVRLADALVRRLGLDLVPLGLCGGLLVHVEPLRRRVLRGLADLPQARAHRPRHAPVEGALILLKQHKEGLP